MEKIINNDLEYLQDIMDNTWGDDEITTEALFQICNEDRDLCEKIIKEDKTSNRYSCVGNWSTLAYEIINDDCFQSIIYKTYLEPIIEIKDNESKCKDYLYKQGWRLHEDLCEAFLLDIDDLKEEGYDL